jgi:Tubulin-tyrosine ligase family
MMFNETFDIFLLEVNMSPNLNATMDKIHNKPLFENVLYNLFNLVGVGTSYTKTGLNFPNKDVEVKILF